ncbi:MAG: undecaprenyl-phosphate glucose phosphotransferase, partial [Flavobacteriales bacterium]|nr:undecaprenyl-phosphate glucose phosphotransferase [Flavobacteriales bacterium]
GNFSKTHVYNLSRIVRLEQVFKALYSSVFLHILVISFLSYVFRETIGIRWGYWFFIYCYLLNVVFLSAWRLFSSYLIKNYRRMGYGYRNVVIIGEGFSVGKLSDIFITEKHYGYKLLKVFNSESSLRKGDLFDNISNSLSFIKNNDIHEVYFAMSLVDSDIFADVSKYCNNNLIRLKILPDFGNYLPFKFYVNFFGNVPVLSLIKEPLQRGFLRFLKRIFDVVFSFFVIIFSLFFLFPWIVLMIKLTSKGPVLFRQKRSGLDNNIFVCYKFRTLFVSENNNINQIKKNDSRVTKFGSFLRRTSLDEIPQFFNVLKGEMSVVGPRPHMLIHTKEYSSIVRNYMLRHLVKPGITGQAQVNGYRGEIKHVEDIKKRVQLDIWYINNWSFFLDLKLIFKTFFMIFLGDEKAY